MTYISKLFNPVYWKKGATYLKRFGVSETIRHFRYGKPLGPRYQEYFERHRVTPEQLEEQRNHRFERNPRISIVIPIYNTREDFLKALLDSIRDQSYPGWELCLADGSTKDGPGEYIRNYAAENKIQLIDMTDEQDAESSQTSASAGAATSAGQADIASAGAATSACQPGTASADAAATSAGQADTASASADATVTAGATKPAPVIRYSRLKTNDGISGNTNQAIAMATGDFIMFADHDDFLELDALYEFVRILNDRPDTDIIYTDEDLCNEDGTAFESPRYKPDYNPDFLTSINYICHIFLVRRTLLEEAGPLDKAYDGAQDWDFVLRCCEKTDESRIAHVPKILYHWRAYEQSTAGNQSSKDYALDAGRRAVQAHFDRIGQKVILHDTGIFVMFRPQILVTKQPKVSIVIPNKDHVDLLINCLDSIITLTTWKNYEIIIVENNSSDTKTFQFYDEIREKNDKIKLVTYQGEFNYSAVNNLGAKAAEGEYLLLLNNDTKVITPDWIEEMLGFCQREDTAIVGAKLLYPDDTIQHCGVVVGLGGFAGHIEPWRKRTDTGYFGRLQAVQDISAVTGACLMIRKSVYDQVGGLDESFAVALNDVDLCLRVREKGYKVVVNPGAELYHYESKSRGSDEKESPEKHARFKKEVIHFRQRWADFLEKGDPYYNPNLTLRYGDCRVKESEEEKFEMVREIEKDKARKK